MVGLSIRRFDRDGLIQTQREILREVEMQFVYTRVAGGGKPQPRLVEKRRSFLAALRARDAELATRLMRSHLASVHRLLEPFVQKEHPMPARAAA